MTLPLLGRRIAVPESRQLEQFAALLEKQGAEVLRCPLVGIGDAPDAAPIEAWLKTLIAGELDDLIILTGEGVVRLLGFAERAGMREPFVEALARVRKITRGPKPALALKELGL